MTAALTLPARRHPAGLFLALVSRPGGAIGTAVLAILVLAAIFAPLVAPFDPTEVDVCTRLSAPAAGHWFGCDLHGRDVFSRVVWGARYSLSVGVATLAVSLTLGATLGLLLGYRGGRIDAVGSRILDVMMGFPHIVLAITVVSVLGVGLVNVVLAVAIADIPTYARVMRGATLQARQNLFVEQAASMGAGSFRIMRLHLLPTVLPTLILMATLNLGAAILSTATLSFLGLGAQPPAPEWGTMLNDGRDYVRYAPWMMLAPGLTLFAAIMAVNLIGDRLNTLIDPRSRRRGA